MELSRRDALAALAAGGAAVGGVGALTWNALSEDDGPTVGEREAETLVAVAGVVYPDAASGVREFVETYVVGRVREDPTYAAGVADAVAALDEYASTWEDAPFAALDAGTREELLRGLDVDVADPDPGGDRPERVRYYLVNELLYAFYASPTGGRLVGIENPQGHPGGTESYQRGPDA